MAFDVSGLDNYTDQTSTDLFVQDYVTSKTATYAQKIDEVKSAIALHRFVTAVTRQDGAACGFTSSGTVAFTDRVLTTYPIKYQQVFCARDLQPKWTQLLLNAGQDIESQEPGAVIINDLSKKVQADLESTDWTGTVAANKYDGIETILNTANMFTQANHTDYGTVQTAVNETTVDEIMIMLRKAAIAKFPHWMNKSSVKVFVPMSWIGYLSANLLDKNYYHVSPKDIQAGNMPFLLTPWEFVGVYGLTGTTAWMFDTEHLFLGLDSSSDETSAKIWYSEDDDNHKWSLRLRRGWQHVFPQEVLKFSL